MISGSFLNRLAFAAALLACAGLWPVSAYAQSGGEASQSYTPPPMFARPKAAPPNYSGNLVRPGVSNVPEGSPSAYGSDAGPPSLIEGRVSRSEDTGSARPDMPAARRSTETPARPAQPGAPSTPAAPGLSVPSAPVIERQAVPTAPKAPAPAPAPVASPAKPKPAPKAAATAPLPPQKPIFKPEAKPETEKPARQEAAPPPAPKATEKPPKVQQEAKPQPKPEPAQPAPAPAPPAPKVKASRTTSEGVVTGPKTMPAVEATDVESETLYAPVPSPVPGESLLERHQRRMQGAASPSSAAKPAPAAPPAPAPSPAVQAAQPPQGDIDFSLPGLKVVMDGVAAARVPYPKGSSGLPPALEELPRRIVAELGRRPDARLQIQSYATDDAGKSNKPLALSRALALREALLAEGVEPARLDLRTTAEAKNGPADRIDLYFFGPQATP